MTENSPATHGFADSLPQTPFWHLVAHFVKRMFSSDEDSGTESMSLGIGAVLAILATPGTLTCFFLLEKYAHPLILLRGHRFDAYKLSGPDEYFFIILSMTITGLIMVLRWNRLFPDRRDFANLAVLPISARDVFLANLTALAALAVLFAIVINGASWFLFPAIVTFADGSFSAFFRVAVSHAVAVFSASMFSFFGVFAVVGALMLFVPGRLFRLVSVWARLCFAVAIITAPFSDLLANFFVANLHGTHDASLKLLPSFWFLGLYESIARFATPLMSDLAHQALFALLLVILFSLGAYSLSYGRYYLRLPETFDLLHAPHDRLRLSLPAWLERLFFSSPFEQGCISFAFKALFRSERHLLFFGAYLGVGCMLVAQTLLGRFSAPAASLPNADVLAIPLIAVFFLLTALRFVFDIPATLNANWIFRCCVDKPQPPLGSIVRKLAFTLTLPWQFFLLAPVMARLYGWPVALEHTALVLTLTLLLVELLFANFCTIPFTCVIQADLRQTLSRILGSLCALTLAIPLLAALERWMLFNPLRFVSGAGIALAVWLLLREAKRDLSASGPTLIFEQRPPSEFELLKLT